MMEHSHSWETGSWGGLIGVSRCTECGALSRSGDFRGWNSRNG